MGRDIIIALVKAQCSMFDLEPHYGRKHTIEGRGLQHSFHHVMAIQGKQGTYVLRDLSTKYGKNKMSMVCMRWH